MTFSMSILLVQECMEHTMQTQTGTMVFLPIEPNKTSHFSVGVVKEGSDLRVKGNYALLLDSESGEVRFRLLKTISYAGRYLSLCFTLLSGQL